MDYDLAAEALKTVDSKVYEFYKKFKTQGVSKTEIKNDFPTFYKTILFLNCVDKLNELESDGLVKILNDYQNRRVVVERI